MTAWQDEPAHRDPRQPRRRAAVDRLVRRARAERASYLHHNFVVALLNDLFGIQSRGGCSCAGPYGHRLLGIDLDRSHEFEREIAHGCEGIKPGWVRVNFNYFISETVVHLHRRRGAPRRPRRLAAARATTASTRRPGCGSTAAGLVEPPLRLAQVSYLDDGAMGYPHLDDRAPESELARYLDEAAALLAAAAAPTCARRRRPAGVVSEDFEHLRWFELPEACLPY